jgi:hypothetical protein
MQGVHSDPVGAGVDLGLLQPARQEDLPAHVWPGAGEDYLGKITNWNAPAIKKINPGKNLPDQQITVVHRSDGSGTTYNFTDYLSSVSKTWKNQVGKGTAVNWPAGTGAPHSSGVANVVRQTPGRSATRRRRFRSGTTCSTSG